jgi:hypothetical protein
LQWEQVAFAPAPLEPGLPKWTIYLDLNNNGVLDSGEPFQVTDLNGNYAFTNLAPGTYYVREVQNTGWTQTAPTPVPPGKYTVTLASGQTITGLDFGNHQTAANSAPHITSTAITTATVGQVYRYNVRGQRFRRRRLDLGFARRSGGHDRRSQFHAARPG